MNNEIKFVNQIDLRKANKILKILNPRKRYHRAELIGAGNIPLESGAILVSNHGRLTFDFFI